MAPHTAARLIPFPFKPTMKKAIVCLFAAVLAAAFSSAQSEPVKIRIGYASALHGQVAKALGEAGIARKHGLEAELSFFQYGPPQAEALASKNLDVSFTSLVPTSSLLSKKPGYVKVVAALGSSVHGLVVQGGGDIKTLADLKGKTIGLPFGSDSHVDLLVALKAAGLDPATDVKLQNLAPNEQAAPFQQKLVDGVLARPPLEQRLQKEFGGREIQQWPHHLWAIARTDYLNENPGVEARLQAAITEAVLYVVAHPEIIQRLAEVKMITGIGCSLLAENVVATLLANGAYRKLIQRLRQRLNKQMASTLRQLDPAHWEVFAEPLGGMFVWARPRHLAAQRVQQIARELQIQLSQGSTFLPQGEACDWLRLNVAYTQDHRAQVFFQRVEQESTAVAQ